MAFYDYWYQKQRANRALNDTDNKLTLSIASFKSELEKAFLAGKREGVSEQAKVSNPFDSLFGKFGK